MNDIKPFKEDPIASALIDILSEVAPDLDSAIKWSRLTYTLDEDYHFWICSIAILKNRTNLLFHYGGLFDDPGRILLSGNNRFLRYLSYRSIDEIDRDAVAVFLNRAFYSRDEFIRIWNEKK